MRPGAATTRIRPATRKEATGRAGEAARKGPPPSRSRQREIRFLGGIVILKTVTPIPARIQFTASGVGATKAKPATTEKQRLRNRRVEIIFERGAPVRPPQPFFDILEATKRAIRNMPRPPIPIPPPNFFTKIVPPPRKDEWRAFLELLREGPLRFVDLKTVVEGVIDVVGPPKDQEALREDWIDSMLDALKEDEDERRKRTLDPPGDPDEEDD